MEGSDIKLRYVWPLDDYQLLLEFTNGELRIYDVLPYLKQEEYKHLCEVSLFEKATLRDDCIKWPEGPSIAFKALYEESIPFGGHSD